MFPPSQTKVIEECIGNLWLSLQRAAPQWHDEATIEMKEDKYHIVLPLHQPLPKGSKSAVGSFIRGYLKLAGWKPEKVEAKNTYVLVVASKP